MNLLPGVQRLTYPGGTLDSGGHPVRVFIVGLSSGSTSSTATLLNGEAVGATQYGQLSGLTNDTAWYNFAGGLRFPAGCYVNLDTNANYATVSYTEEF